MLTIGENVSFSVELPTARLGEPDLLNNRLLRGWGRRVLGTRQRGRYDGTGRARQQARASPGWQCVFTGAWDSGYQVQRFRAARLCWWPRDNLV